MMIHSNDIQPNTMKAFSDFSFDERLQKAISDLEFTTPTPIQIKAMPPIMEGKDVIGIAQTGTGKTAAFTLPFLQRYIEQYEGKAYDGPTALILSPTRELAFQVEEKVRQFSKYLNVNVTLLLGGVPYEKQLRGLRAKPDVIVATPGRLLDHLKQKNLRLTSVDVFVLDEADRMLDMGFMPDIRSIMGFLGKKQRQTLMFSATFPDAIARLASQLLREPVRVDVSPPVRTPQNIKQRAYYVEKIRKPRLLRELLAQPEMTSVMVFCGMKVEADFIYTILEADGLRVGVLHSNRPQKERTRALEQFREGAYAILVATDIAARGLDIKDVTHVINYDLPNNFEDYVHRVGRTARAEAHGEAVTLVTPGDYLTFKKIEEKLGSPIERLEYAGITVERGWPEGSTVSAEPAAPSSVRRRRRG